ncbi:NADH-quinone oxidoreductase subunit NuoE [Clostridium ganghwense]|uniref:NADH-quinone oxidoreductase subunit NuoE n=1 Tax=Clostridium ganghwense TaxID=312089 RepID=A0ABT4CQZ2_9CLOT|nr:NADH-quinone oxidoreductase subunit NuoE [Clostridium ganghwense]MCY6371454.1 NADH-quinone oxidoreductase subunit NuoE [Clostridium ganghwense]
MKEKQCCCDCNERDERLEKTQQIIEEHKEVKGALIPILHQIQELYGYLPEEALHLVSKELKISMSEIYGVATFYSLFTLEPKGKHVIRVCMGTACYVKGSQSIVEKLNSILGIEVGKTTKDGKFTLEAARCLGSCGLAPVMMIDDRVYGKVTPDDVIKILEEYK